MNRVVLVVDDSFTVRMDLTDALTSGGLRAVGCGTVEEARAAFDRETVGFVILDLDLPDKSGTDLLREMRSTKRLSTIPVMILRADAEAPAEIRGLLNGADDYAGKPYDPAVVVSRAREVLDRPELSKAVPGKRTVLIVDDSPSYRGALETALAGESFEVLAAGSGEEGLQILAERRPDAAIIDGVLPGIDGATVVRRMRLDAATRGTPCILLTASEDRSAELAALDAGADAFVRKTEDFSLVLARLSAVLRVARHKAADRSTSSLLGSKTILAVDDSRTFREELAAALGERGYDVVQASSGEDALELLGGRSVDCILLDLVMPGIGGHETCRRVKAVPHLRDTPLVLLTAREDREALIEGLAAGADDFIVKSGDFDVVRARVVAQLRRAQFEEENRSYREHLLRFELEAEQRYRRILETTQEGVWTFDERGRTTYANRRMAEMLGVDPEEMAGTSLHDFLDPAEIGFVFPHPSLASSERREIVVRRRSGTQFWASVASTPLRSDGRYRGGLAMVSDVTEQRRIQTQLLVADRMVSVGTLAAGVAHEINNPLTAVLANLELAIADTDTPAVAPNVRQALCDAKEGAERVRRIVRDLKIFSRGESEEVGPVDVLAVVESSLRMTANEIKHRAQVVKDLSPVPAVIGDSSRLGQVFLNLLVNAAQAIPEGRATENTIKIRTRSEGPSVVVEVSDSGEGMSQETVARLFSPFFTTKPIGVGTGLGLSICHRIITSYGGEISVESVKGVGSTFRVRLVASTAAPVLSQSKSESLSSMQRARVLLVDDDADVAKAVGRLLRPAHDVTIAADSSDALKRIESGETYDLILCDLMMPVMTGVDFYEALMTSAPDQAAKMIFLTGGAFTPRAREFLAEVHPVHLEKPIDRATLLRAVADHLAKREERR